MKLISVLPRSIFLGAQDMPAEERDSLYIAENAAIASYLHTCLDHVGMLQWRVTYKEVWKDVQPQEGLLTNSQAIEVITKCLEGTFFVILRDSTCRFLQVGQDGDLKMCLHSEDRIPNPTSSLIMIKNMSDRLIDDDGCFDL